MSHSPRTWLLALSLLAALPAAGCKQQEGELCDSDGDCEEGLECAGDCQSDGVVTRRGICMEPPVDEGVCPSRTDGGPRPDAALPEAGVDDGGAADDAGAGEDAGAMDAGADAGAVIDAGSDAGADDAGADAGLADSGVADAA